MESSQKSILSVDGVEKAFGGIHAVDRCTLKVLPHSITGLIGPNGAGKSTLFNIIAGLYRPDGGGIWFDGPRNAGVPPYESSHLVLTKRWHVHVQARHPTVLGN